MCGSNPVSDVLLAEWVVRRLLGSARASQYSTTLVRATLLSNLNANQNQKLLSQFVYLCVARPRWPLVCCASLIRMHKNSVRFETRQRSPFGGMVYAPAFPDLSMK
jgi:hypothetical protein